MWGLRGRTPAAQRTGYDLAARDQAPSTPYVLAQRPALSPDTAVDAFGEWLAHVDAGRIAVR